MNFGYLNYSELDYTCDGYSPKLWDLEPFNFDIIILYIVYVYINIHNLLLHMISKFHHFYLYPSIVYKGTSLSINCANLLRIFNSFVWTVGELVGLLWILQI